MHEFFLRKALSQAQLGLGKCAPNPSVGAVAVKDGQILAQAFHQGPGFAHAERRVLDKVSSGIDGITLYVTLEPCNHWGKTPPCIDIIIERGIKEVIYGYVDPNPLVSKNNTPQRLQAHGIKTQHITLPEIDAFYQSYRYWLLHKKPWVTVKIAQSLDGKIARAGGLALQISNQACHELTHQARKKTDVILTTAATLNNDNPRLTARIGTREWQKPIAILDADLSLPHHLTVVRAGGPLHIFHGREAKLINPLSQATYHAVDLNDGLLDLNQVLFVLGKLGKHDVWVEAGARLFSSFHLAQLVQRTYIYVAPNLIGSEGIDAYLNGELLSPKHQLLLTIKDNNLVARFDWEVVPCLPD